MQAEETGLDRIEIKKLEWFGHLMTMLQERWPAKIHAWIPVGRRNTGRPRRRWRAGVTEAMEKRRMVGFVLNCRKWFKSNIKLKFPP
jgi:hypothetical protein